MTKVLVTGGSGFLGRNLTAHLELRKDCTISVFGRGDPPEKLVHLLVDADIVFHLAGVNRPQHPGEFEIGNAGLTQEICHILKTNRRSPKVVFSSSVQAELNNPYGASKADAESFLLKFASETAACVRIYRLKNLFGKWCRPNYNSVTATFCHNIANDLPISVSDPEREVELTYVDDVVAAFAGEIDNHGSGGYAGGALKSHKIRLGELAGKIQAFHEIGSTLVLPDFAGWFNRALYATYLSYVPASSRQSPLQIRLDDRGSLAEFIKQDHLGQIFVSRTRPGITRGNHYHHTKTEKFLVVEGEGLIRMRDIRGGPVEEYSVRGNAFQVVNIPPGITHSITNIGLEEMVTLFWASEIFNPDRPDTYYLPVDSDVRRNSKPAVSA